MPKIVVVEDQPVLATVYRSKFTAEGYQVEVASDGEAGLNLINTAKPDLVILDVMLPKLNGIEVLKKIRANTLFQDLPVLIFSNSGLPGMIEEAWKAGATMVLSKSSHSPKQIVESVRTALKAASENQSPPTSAAVNGPTASSPVSVLVEDHPDTRALLSFLLDQAGHQVTSVESHAGAVQKAKANNFDLCLLNRVCPDGVGISLCRELRHSYPRLPIGIYSTSALPTEQQAGLDAGASIYLTKPSDITNIGNFTSELLKTSKTSTAGIEPAPVAVNA
jgi:DNA-binding response OmpR family regulator